MRLGQNFLADPNLLAAIVEDAQLGPGDVVLEVGAGAGALTERLLERARLVHAIEIDTSLEPVLARLAGEPGLQLHWGDALRLELAKLAPEPVAMVSNLPYSVATPVILRTLGELPRLERWTLMVQREIADRLRAAPGSRLYGGPSVLVQLATTVKLLRRVDRAVFNPRPRVDSAVISMRRTGSPPPPEVRRLVREAFAHRRKALARSLELARPGRIDAVRAALGALGLRADARAEMLSPEDFRALALELGDDA